jgi:hypothetical protein
VTEGNNKAAKAGYLFIDLPNASCAAADDCGAGGLCCELQHRNWASGLSFQFRAL